MSLVTVIIPTYNRARYLPATLDSVLRQTLRDFEVIVVDDGSTDDTVEVLRPYSGRISYLSQPNQREGAARNHGIRHSTGEFLAFLDSDDLWLPHKLEADVEAFRRWPEAALVYSRAASISSTGERLGGRKMRSPRGDVFDQLVHENFITLSTVVVRRDAFEAVGLFTADPELSGSMDWEAWVRLAARSPVAYIPALSTYVRVHGSNMLSDGAHMERAMVKAGELILDNPELHARLAGRQARFRASLYLAIAVNHSSNGNMRRARHFLARAVRAWPLHLCNPRVVATFFTSLLGSRLAARLRRSRRRLVSRVARHWRLA